MTLQIYRSLSDATFPVAASRAGQSEEDDAPACEQVGYRRTGLVYSQAAE